MRNAFLLSILTFFVQSSAMAAGSTHIDCSTANNQVQFDLSNVKIGGDSFVVEDLGTIFTILDGKSSEMKMRSLSGRIGSIALSNIREAKSTESEGQCMSSTLTTLKADIQVDRVTGPILEKAVGARGVKVEVTCKIDQLFIDPICNETGAKPKDSNGSPAISAQ